ncbi:hypothetical protein CW751_14730 [Brumimicrobium salinarum]|uniref:Uncharacterized protein n=1 Tax=Brumimicrobium salinarum TaxID=2058658 RepID=A0A2I0QYY6_9FLAO|nr:hypothetical protein CW751_14730 [Brumimicrobium salinarum]
MVNVKAQEVAIHIFDKDFNKNINHDIYILNSSKGEVVFFLLENEKIKFKVNKNDNYIFLAPFYNKLDIKGYDLLQLDTLELVPKNQNYEEINIQRYSKKSLIKEWRKFIKKNRHEIGFSKQRYLNFLQTTIKDTIVESYYSFGNINTENNEYKIISGDFRFGRKINFISLNINELLLLFSPFNMIKVEPVLTNFILPSKGLNKRLNGFKVSSNSSPNDSLIRIKIDNEHLSEETIFNKVNGNPVQTSIQLYSAELFQQLNDSNRTLIADSVFLKFEYDNKFISKFYYKILFKSSRTEIQGYFIQQNESVNPYLSNYTLGQFKRQNTYSELILKRSNNFQLNTEFFSAIDSLSLPSSKLEHFLLSKVTSTLLLNQNEMNILEDFIDFNETESTHIQRFNSFEKYDNYIPFIWHYRFEKNINLNFFPTFFDRTFLLTIERTKFLTLKMYIIYNYIEHRRKSVEQEFHQSIDIQTYRSRVKTTYHEIKRDIADWIEFPLDDQMLYILTKKEVLNNLESIADAFIKNNQVQKDSISIFNNQPDLEDILKLSLSNKDKNKIINFYLKINIFYINQIRQEKNEYSEYEYKYLLLNTIILKEHIGKKEDACYYLTILKNKYHNVYSYLIDSQKSFKTICQDN